MEQMLQAALKGVEFWMGHGYSMEDAFDHVHGGNFGSPREIAGSKPLASFDWDDMRRMEKAETGSSEKIRELLLRQARAEIKDGRRGARAVAYGTLTPLDEARYLALVEELSEGWNPRNGIERTLIEQMAQAHIQYLHWQHRLNKISSGMAWEEPKRPSASGKEPWLARVTQSEAANQAANMADRSQRMFLRTQRALRDLRRHSVTIERVDQLNMGEQQVNINAGKRESD